jgi:hypothetical protein
MISSLCMVGFRRCGISFRILKGLFITIMEEIYLDLYFGTLLAYHPLRRDKELKHTHN